MAAQQKMAVDLLKLPYLRVVQESQRMQILFLILIVEVCAEEFVGAGIANCFRFLGYIALLISWSKAFMRTKHIVYELSSAQSVLMAAMFVAHLFFIANILYHLFVQSPVSELSAYLMLGCVCVYLHHLVLEAIAHIEELDYFR